MKKLKFGDLLCGLLWAAQGIAEALTIWSVWRLDMLPDQYFASLAAALVAVWLIVGAVLFVRGRKKSGAFEKKKKQGPGLFRRIVGGLLAVVMTVGCAVVNGVVSDVHSTVDGITGAAQTMNVSMSVYVLAEDPVGSIADAEDHTFAILDGYETGRTEKAIHEISQQIGAELNVTSYATLAELVEALYQGECDAIILNSAYVTLLEDTEEFQDFSQRTRVLYTAILEETVIVAQPEENDESQPTGETTPEETEFSVTTHPFILYISGSDTRDYYLTTSRSDVNILMAVNPVTKQILLVNTPRDYFVSNPAGNGAKDKLTHCGIYGTGCSMGALEGLYGVDIRYYAQINFTGVETLVDAIGGIDVYSDEGFYAGEIYWINEGMNHLDGEHALLFARDRYNVTGGDNGRGRHQMAVIQAVINKVTSGTTILENYAGILESIQGMFKTNVSSEEISQLVKMQLTDLASWNILSFAVTGTGGSDITYSMPGLFCYVMYPDEEMVAYGSELIQRVLDGDTLTSADLTLPG